MPNKEKKGGFYFTNVSKFIRDVAWGGNISFGRQQSSS
jgi:hypothetical protein